VTGFLSCVGLSATLPRLTWIYMLTWLIVGTLIFFVSLKSELT
jgi:hypothetical protein